MSDFNIAYKKMQIAEYNGKESLFVHKHSDEQGYTVGGIYQKANPNAVDYHLIDKIVKAVGDIKRASIMIYHDEKIQFDVFKYFKKNYWDISRLSELHDNKMAQEIYMASVLYGVKRAVKMAQELAKVSQDGVIGNYSIKGLNNLDPLQFDMDYDILENKLAEKVAHDNNKEHYLDGWHRRANDSWDIKV